jgi:hypothetical protein
MMRLQTEDQILDTEIRKRIIQEIESGENQQRKNEAFRRHQCFKDKTNHYVAELLLSQLEAETVKEMLYALSNISITKKIIDKLARVYNNGVKREVTGDQTSTDKIQKLDKALSLTTELKKTNRFLRLQKNTALYLKPCPVEMPDGSKKWTIKPEPMNPYLYDVIENNYDRTKAMVYVLSDFKPTSMRYSEIDPGKRPSGMSVALPGNGVDGMIADTPSDKNQGDRKTYIFWSNKYHFTCDDQGTIIAVDGGEVDNANPFGLCPIVNFAVDQDGNFWAEGGGDIIDGSILINAVITHTIHTGVVQGYGQFYAIGEGLPRSIKVGPTRAIIAEYKKDEQAKPEFGYLNANPQLADLQKLIEMYIALILTTNNLSTSGIQAQLTGAQNLASGVALIIDKSESLEDVQDQQQVFVDKEPKIFKVLSAIVKTYGADMVDELKGLDLPEKFEENFSAKFNEQQAILTEKEKLENLKLRSELGLDTMIGLLMREDPTLTEKQAEEKLEKILREKIKEESMRQQIATEMGVELETVPQDQGTEGNVPEDPEGGENLEENEEAAKGKAPIKAKKEKVTKKKVKGKKTKLNEDQGNDDDK